MIELKRLKFAANVSETNHLAGECVYTDTVFKREILSKVSEHIEEYMKFKRIGKDKMVGEIVVVLPGSPGWEKIDP